MINGKVHYKQTSLPRHHSAMIITPRVSLYNVQKWLYICAGCGKEGHGEPREALGYNICVIIIQN